jgi:hypothetical protein
MVLSLPTGAPTPLGRVRRFAARSTPVASSTTTRSIALSATTRSIAFAPSAYTWTSITPFAFFAPDSLDPLAPSPDVRSILARTPRLRRLSSLAVRRGNAGASAAGLALRRYVNKGIATAAFAYDDADKLRGAPLVDEGDGGGDDRSLKIHSLLPYVFTVLCIYAES